MTRRLPPLMLAVLVAGCGGGPPAPAPEPGAAPELEALHPEAEGPWLPARPRAAWVYEGVREGKVLGRKVFHCLRRIQGRYKVEEYIGRRLLSWGLLGREAEGWRYQGNLWLPEDLEVGRRWVWKGAEYYTDEGGPPAVARASAVEDVFVPVLGRSVPAIRVEYDGPVWDHGAWTTGWRRTRWWVRGLGVVREHMTYRPDEWGAAGDPDGSTVELTLVELHPGEGALP